MLEKSTQIADITVMSALKTIVEELKSLPPEKLDEAANLIHALKED